MKALAAAITLSVFCFILGSCSEETGEIPPIVVPDLSGITSTTTSMTTASSVPVSTTKVSTASSVTTTETDTTTTINPSDENYNSKELEMLEKEGKPDYNVIEAAIPYVGWTEVNLDKYMYPVQKCIGYQYALPDAKAVMVYDAGIALEVIARTSTGYYRIRNDIYIPCDFLSNEIPAGINAEIATSAPAVSTQAVSVQASQSS